MVPSFKFLQAVGLVAFAAPDGQNVAQALLADSYLAVPGTMHDFVGKWVLPSLSPAVEAAFLTTDVNADFRPFFLAAAELGITEAVGVFAAGPTVVLPDEIKSWRKNKTLRIFIETYQLSSVPQSVLIADLAKLFGRQFDESMLTLHATLFSDREWLKYADGWTNYEACVGKEEADFKRGLLAQPSDYMRWKLGVPVTLDTSTVLDRMISDAYYTERLIKGRVGMDMDKETMARVKFERDTLFKAIDRKQKIRALEIESGVGTGSDAVVAAIKQIAFKYADEAMLMVDELTEG